MCTVTFIARERGYILGMNRDEKRSRPAGFAPKNKMVQGCAVVGPSEPGGGTWIALNDHGATLALINWYSVETRVEGNSVSRGEVVNAVSASGSPNCVGDALQELPLDQINPFRLIGVFPRTREIVEWRWDLNKLARQRYSWKARQWISSGFDEATAQRIRGDAYQQTCLESSMGSVRWLRRLHRSHSPEVGPFSTCMHRADAITVSYTEVIVSPRRAEMRYHAGAPCTSATRTVCCLQLSQSPSPLTTADSRRLIPSVLGG